MIDFGAFKVLHRRQQVEEEQTRRLAELNREWDRTIRGGLQHLAQALWPDGHVLGLIPAHHYRLRHQVEPGIGVWWVERDIPPDDEHRCAAYRVLLTLDAQKDPVLTVQSGASQYPVAPLTETALEETLAQAGQDPALVILRQFEEARE
jgi:hypothetical protein